MAIGLALSGGGFRATLFHLGVVRCLREANLLTETTHICSVSGGSVIAAHLVKNWDEYLHCPDRIEDELVSFTMRCVRGRIVRRLPFLFLSKTTPFPTGYPKSNNEFFQNELDKYLFDFRGLHSIREVPKLHILATNMTNGGLVSFSQDGFSFDFGSDAPEIPDPIPSANLPLSLAVGCSAAFPALFSPVRVNHDILGVNQSEFGAPIGLSDGGIYDNLGLRKMLQIEKHESNPFDKIIISDASGAFDDRWLTKSSGIVGTTIRSSDILMNRIYQLERERIIENEERQSQADLIDVNIGARIEKGTLHVAVQDKAKFVRTDFDFFSRHEQAPLSCHGFDVCAAALGSDMVNASKKHVLQNGKSNKSSTQEDRMFCETTNASKMVRTLQSAQSRKLRIVSFTDYIWVIQLIVLLAIIFLGIPYTGKLIDQTRLAVLPGSKKIVIAGKQFEEQSILLEMMAEVIKEEIPDIKIERRHYHGNNIELYYDLIYGEIDLYPEYTGTVLSVGLAAKLEDIKKEKKEEHELERVNSRLAKDNRANNLKFLHNFGFSNSYQMVTLVSLAKKWKQKVPMNLEDLATISQKDGIAIKGGFTHTFTSRPDCLNNLIKKYSIKFDDTEAMDHDEKKYQKLRKGDVNLIDGYETDPELANKETFLPIDDNNGAFPLYNAATFTRDDFAKKNPRIVRALSKLEGQVEKPDMIALINKAREKDAASSNVRTDHDMQLRLRGIVREFLISKNIISISKNEN